MELVRGIVLIVTTILLGLISGLFYTFSVSVMRSLRGVDDKTFVNVMQRINRDIQNGKFAVSFMGSLLFLVLSLVLFIGVDTAMLVPIIIGLVFYIVCFGVTLGINVPMNIRLERKGPPERIADLAGARQEFEARWTKFNTVRGTTAGLAMAAMCWALLQYTIS